MAKPLVQATGRRKSSVARVRLYDGTGQLTLNGRPLDEYFPQLPLRLRVSNRSRLLRQRDVTTSTQRLRAAVTPARATRFGSALLVPWSASSPSCAAP